VGLFVGGVDGNGVGKTVGLLVGKGETGIMSILVVTVGRSVGGFTGEFVG
jgi:hypothetical protein